VRGGEGAVPGPRIRHLQCAKATGDKGSYGGEETQRRWKGKVVEQKKKKLRILTAEQIPDKESTVACVQRLQTTDALGSLERAGPRGPIIKKIASCAVAGVEVEGRWNKSGRFGVASREKLKLLYLLSCRYSCGVVHPNGIRTG